MKRLAPENVFESARRVDDAAVCAEESTYTTPEAFDRRMPAVVVERLMNPAIRFVVEAVVNEPYVVDAKLKRLTPDQVFESARRVVEETVIDEPRATEEPLIVMEELVRPELLRVPVIEGVKVRAPAVGTMFWAIVRPLND